MFSSLWIEPDPPPCPISQPQAGRAQQQGFDPSFPWNMLGQDAQCGTKPLFSTSQLPHWSGYECHLSLGTRLSAISGLPQTYKFSPTFPLGLGI